MLGVLYASQYRAMRYKSPACLCALPASSSSFLKPQLSVFVFFFNFCLKYYHLYMFLRVSVSYPSSHPCFTAAICSHCKILFAVQGRGSGALRSYLH